MDELSNPPRAQGSRFQEPEKAAGSKAYGTIRRCRTKELKRISITRAAQAGVMMLASDLWSAMTLFIWRRPRPSTSRSKVLEVQCGGRVAAINRDTRALLEK